MRDPKRIPIILEELRRRWELDPGWRLCQLIVNLFGRDPFYVEDDEVLRELRYDIIRRQVEKGGVAK